MKNRKVDFIITGTQKGGTTSSAFHMNQHSNIFMPTLEMHFFDDKNFSADYSKYHSRFKKDFSKISSNILIGEKTPSLSFIPITSKRIYEYNPNCKIILLAREPISRAYSQWNMYMQGNKKRDIGNTFREFVERQMHVQVEDITQNGFYPLQRGMYFEHIKSVLKYFPKENLKVIVSEELKKDPTNQYNSIFDFLQISRTNNIKFNPGVHKRSYKDTIKKEDFLFLKDFFSSHNQNFYEFMGREIPSWESKYLQYE